MTPNRTRSLLASCGLREHEALRLLMRATGMSRSQILLDAQVSDDQMRMFEVLVAKRLDNEPLQYLEGDVDFGPITVAVDERVLIPRPETERLLERASELVNEPRVIIDLCTGSGNLAIALSAAWPEARVHATEISLEATQVASKNVVQNQATVTVYVGDLFSPLPGELRRSADLIVANPPYLSEREVEAVPPDVRREPRVALVSGPEGDEILRRIADEAMDWLRPGGAIVCEISEFHGDHIREIFAAYDAHIEVDLAGRDRFVVGRRGVE